MSTPLLFSRNNMSKPKYDFTKEELQCVYNREKTFSKAAKVLGVSKTTFRQQYLKSQNKCIVCASENDSLTNTTCTKCQRPKELHPDTKFCSRCCSQIKRDKSKSKLSWNKTHVCQSCKDKTNKKCMRQAYVRIRPKKLHKQRTSKEYKDYQKEYRESEHGKLRRKISNIKRKCAKITTCSDGINDHIEKLFNNPDKKCMYCESTDKLSVEHKTPLSRGGTHTEDNVDLACLPCNISKGNKTVEEYQMYLKEIKDN